MELKENKFIARMTSTIGGILNNLEQYEEEIKYWSESIVLAKLNGQAPDEFFILDHCDFLASTLS